MKISSLASGGRPPNFRSAWSARECPQFLIYGWLIACPLCFGGVDLWARATGWLVVGVTLILMAWLDPGWWRIFRGTGWIVAALFFWILASILPLPVGWLKVIAAARFEGLSHTICYGNRFASLAYEPSKTIETVLTITSGFLAVTFFAHWAGHHEGRKRLIWVILLSGAGVMLVAWLNQFTPGHIYTRKIETTGYMGPFTGRNIFANYLVMCSLVGTGFLFQRWWSLRGATNKSNITWVALAIVLSAVTWIMVSASRGGCLSWVAGIVVFGAFLWGLEGRSRRSTGLFIGLFLLAGLAFIFEQTLIKRFEDAFEHAADGRLAVWKQSLKMGVDHWWSGVGLGNFFSVFPRYQYGIDPKFYTHPENEYLELWNEIGSVGFVIVLVLLAVIARRLFDRRKWKDLEWQAGGLAALIALLAHSFVDFPLHMPANAFLAAAILGLVWGNLSRQQQNDPRFAPAFWQRVGIAIFGILLIFPSFFALRAEWNAQKGNFNAANRFWPIESKYHYLLVKERLNRLEYLEAHRLAVDFLKVRPCDWKLYYFDGWSLAPLYRWSSQAQTAFENAFYWAPAKSETARKAGLFFWPRRPEVSLDFWKRSLELEPDRRRAFYIFLEETKRIPGQQAFGRLLAENETARLITLAQFMTALGTSENAPEILKSALLKPPEKVEDRKNLVCLLLHYNMLDEAGGLLNSTAHGSPWLDYYRAEIYRRQKKWGDALNIYHMLAARFPEEGKRPKLSELPIEILQRKIEMEPDHFDSQLGYAWKLMDAKRWREAETQWNKIRNNWPAFLKAARFQALCLEEQKQLESAADLWRNYFFELLSRDGNKY